MARRCEKIAEESSGNGKNYYVRPDEPNFPTSKREFRWSPSEIEQMLRAKLVGLCRRPEEQFQTAYLLFGRPKLGITLSVFLRVCEFSFVLFLFFPLYCVREGVTHRVLWWKRFH